MGKKKSVKNRYGTLDGFRALSCIAIIAMHIRANTAYSMDGYFYNTIVKSWTWLVYLFLILSAFGMCCGYFEEFKNGTISLEQFYKRRFQKMWPFFAFLVVIAVIFDHTKEALFEGLIELTMIYGLLPNNNLSVLGVSWTLGVIFVFYLVFPFFVYLMSDKKRAWGTFAVSLLINLLCDVYFFSDKFVIWGFTPRHSFLYCVPFFVVGGLLYLYRKEINKIVKPHKGITLIVCVVATILYYVIPEKAGEVDISTYVLLIVFSLWICWAISVRIDLLENKVTKYLSKISMEMYLAQMIIFRVVEKMHMLYIFGHGWISFIFALIITILGLIIFIELYNIVTRTIVKKVEELKLTKIKETDSNG